MESSPEKCPQEKCHGDFILTVTGFIAKDIKSMESGRSDINFLMVNFLINRNTQELVEMRIYLTVRKEERY